MCYNSPILNMIKLLIRLTCAILILASTSCVVEVVESRVHPCYAPRSTHYFPHHVYRYPVITPVSHGFDPDPQYVRGGSWIFRNPNDGLLYSIR